VAVTAKATGYDLRGDLIEACSCMGPCPCWVGDDPDGGSCNSFTGYYIREGQARGVEVRDISYISLVRIPGNVADGNWSEVLFVSDNATDEQYEALVDAFFGRLGGPLADLAALIPHRVAQYRVPITYHVENGVGSIRVSKPEGDGAAIEARMEPYRGPDGGPTRMINSSWNTIPGNEALLGKAEYNRVDAGHEGFAWSYEWRNSIQGLDFRLAHAGD
jgi:hypothetical protein